MNDLDGLDPSDGGFEDLLTTLISDIRHHVDEEENELLSRLRDACTEEQLRDLGRKVERAIQLAPSRPHLCAGPSARE